MSVANSLSVKSALFRLSNFRSFLVPQRLRVPFVLFSLVVVGETLSESIPLHDGPLGIFPHEKLELLFILS